jgi:hypothetical protein
MSCNTKVQWEKTISLSVFLEIGGSKLCMSSQLYAKILKLSTKKLRIQMKAITASVDGVSLSLCYWCLT